MLSAVPEDSPVDPISALSRPSGASPTEWFGLTTGGHAVRVRYRYGYLSVTVVDPASPEREVFGKRLAGPIDGVLGDSAMRGHLSEDGWITGTVDDHPIAAR